MKLKPFPLLSWVDKILGAAGALYVAWKFGAFQAGVFVGLWTLWLYGSAQLNPEEKKPE